MKFSLVAALVVVLAIAHGTESSPLVKRDVSADMEKLAKYFQDMSVMVSKTAEDVIEKLKVNELAIQAETYLEEGRVQLQPVADKLTENAEKIREQLEPLAESIQAQVRPVADTLQAQFEPLTKNLQDQVQMFYLTFLEKTKDLFPQDMLPPQLPKF